MKESYVEGSSDPPRPRVMAACPQGHVASVDRAARRPAIEPCLPAGRSEITPPGRRPRMVAGKATRCAALMRAA